jgi:hypothetical protein
MILADNGSNWFISGETNPTCWNDDDLNRLKNIPGTAFEVIVSPPPPSEVEDDLLKNGGFEAGLANGKKPAFWTLKIKQDIRRCSQNISITGVGVVDVAHRGRCAFEFKGTATTDYIRQMVSLGATIPDGVSLEVNGFSATAGVLTGAGILKANLIYSNGTKTPVTVTLPGGSANYTAFGFDVSALDTAGLSKVNLRVIYKGTAGKLWVDSLSMVLVSSPPHVLPLPVFNG